MGSVEAIVGAVPVDPFAAYAQPVGVGGVWEVIENGEAVDAIPGDETRSAVPKITETPVLGRRTFGN